MYQCIIFYFITVIAFSFLFKHFNMRKRLFDNIFEPFVQYSTTEQTGNLRQREKRRLEFHIATRHGKRAVGNHV